AANAHAPQPIEKEREWRESEHEEQRHDPDGLGYEPHLSQEERARRNEECEAHPPQVPRQPSRSSQASRANRAPITDRRKQHDGANDQRWPDTRATNHL